jgi:hypothetical protein
VNGSKSVWDQRRFVSLGALFSGLALPVTGVADHLARHSTGPTAGSGWIVAHVTVSSLFVLFAAWHGVLNRRALLRYLRCKTERVGLPSREAVAALVLVGGTVAVLVAHAVLDS